MRENKTAKGNAIIVIPVPNDDSKKQPKMKIQI